MHPTTTCWLRCRIQAARTTQQVQKNWNEKFKRSLKEDARPMLIIAPKHPVMLVYDLDQTEGKELPEELTRFSKFEGEWKQGNG